MKTFKKSLFALTLSGVLFIGGRPASAGNVSSNIFLNAVASISPDEFDQYGVPNPSYATWQMNALSALEGMPVAPAGQPYDYSPQTTPISQTAIVSTNFTSWMGAINPTGNYANEAGNEVRFGVAIVATNGATFTLDELGFSLTDTTGLLNFHLGPGAFTFTDPNDGNPEFIGFDSMGNMVVDPDTNVALTRLYGMGPGTTLPATCTLDAMFNCTSDEQALINAAASGFGSDTITGTYTLRNSDITLATGSASVVTTPEPSTWFLMVGAFPAIAAVRRHLGRK